MSDRTDRELLDDIREAIQRIDSYLKGMSYDGFMRDDRTQDAVIRNIEIVGEATKGLSESVREQNPQIPWRRMAGMRDRLVHDYFGINLDIVWEVVATELPKVAAALDHGVTGGGRGRT
jgi:uncharacterized protein with HEPN domain